MPLLWLIDDTDLHHAVAAATVAEVPGWSFDGFLSGADGEAGFIAAVEAGAPLPDVVLMDYMLGDTRGDRVTFALRRREPAGRRMIIVGYSTMASGSAAIVAAGGDAVLPKRGNGAGINPFLLEFLRLQRR